MDNFKELQSYQPDFYRDILEMIAINRANGNQFDLLEQEISKLKNNAIPSTMQIEGVERWERILDLDNKNKTLEVRRAIILTKIRGIKKLSGSLVAQMIKEFQDGEVKVTFENAKLVIKYLKHTTGVNHIGEFEKAFDDLKPARLDWLLQIEKQAVIGLELRSKKSEILYNFLGDFVLGGGELGI